MVLLRRYSDLLELSIHTLRRETAIIVVAAFHEQHGDTMTGCDSYRRKKLTMFSLSRKPSAYEVQLKSDQNFLSDTHTQRERDRERERETDRQTDRQTDRHQQRGEGEGERRKTERGVHNLYGGVKNVVQKIDYSSSLRVDLGQLRVGDFGLELLNGGCR